MTPAQTAASRTRGGPARPHARHPRAGTARSWIMLQALLALGRPDARRHRRSATTPTSARRSAPAGPGRRGDRLPNNEPVQLALARDSRPTVLHVDEITPLPGPGLIVGTVDSCQPSAMRCAAFVAATLRAMPRSTQSRGWAWTTRSPSCPSWPRIATAARDPARRPSRCGRARTLTSTGSARSTRTLGPVAQLHGGPARLEYPGRR